MEHTTEPWLILPEFRRVLRPGGHIILSVPFLYYLHGVPNDYFRFTRYGVQRLASAAGLEIVEWRATGGLAHTILQALSIVATAVLWTRHAPYLTATSSRILTHLANLLDGFDAPGLFRQNINAVLRVK